MEENQELGVRSGWTECQSPADVSRERAFELLSNTRRRHVLSYLSEVGRRVSVRELSNQLAAWENEIPVREVSYDQRRRVHTSLHQLHLPKLDDAGIIEYDSREGSVARTADAPTLERYLTGGSQEPSRWSRWYLAVAVVTACGTAGSYFEFVPLGVSGFGWAATTVGLLAATATVHYRRERQTASDR